MDWKKGSLEERALEAEQNRVLAASMQSAAASPDGGYSPARRSRSRPLYRVARWTPSCAAT